MRLKDLKVNAVITKPGEPDRVILWISDYSYVYREAMSTSEYIAHIADIDLWALKTKKEFTKKKAKDDIKILIDAAKAVIGTYDLGHRDGCTCSICALEKAVNDTYDFE